MARKLPRAAPAAASPAPAGDLEILHPERVLQLGGRRVTVREYGNVEWLRLLGAAEPLIAAVTEAMRGGLPGDYEVALSALGAHIDAALPLVLQAADLTRDEFEALAAGEAELLVVTWWAVNAHFFAQRALVRLGAEVALRQAAASPSRGPASTPRSSPTATTPAT